MAKKYRVTLFGIKTEKAVFRKNMAKLGVSGSTLDKYIERAPVVLKKNLRLEQARKYADAIIDAGGFVHIQETGEFPNNSSFKQDVIFTKEDAIICPNCGFKQEKEKFCARCGFDLSTTP